MTKDASSWTRWKDCYFILFDTISKDPNGPNAKVRSRVRKMLLLHTCAPCDADVFTSHINIKLINRGKIEGSNVHRLECSRDLSSGVLRSLFKR